MVLLDDVNYLISNGIGDLSRLEHIKETLQNNKELYDSDRKYLDELSEKYLFSNQKTVDTPKVEPNTIIKEESSHETLKDSSTEIPIETASQESFCENCGANKGKESNFCSKCGAGVKPQQNTPQQSNPNRMIQRPYEWKSEGTTLVLAIILGILGLCGVGHIYLGNVTRGIIVVIVGFVLLIIAMLSFGIGLIIYVLFLVWTVRDARNKCKFYNEYLEKNQRPPS